MYDEYDGVMDVMGMLGMIVMMVMMDMMGIVCMDVWVWMITEVRGEGERALRKTNILQQIKGVTA